MMEKLRKSVAGSPVVEMSGYQYFVNPVTDGVPRMDPDVMTEITDSIVDIIDPDIDLIVGMEAMGVPLAVALSLRLGIPYTVVRKRVYGIPGETRIIQRTGYSEKEMSINGVHRGDRVVVVDDVLSTGGSMRALLNALMGDIGAIVTNAIVVFEKDRDVTASLRKEFGIPIHALLHTEIADGRVVID